MCAPSIQSAKANSQTVFFKTVLFPLQSLTLLEHGVARADLSLTQTGAPFQLLYLKLRHLNLLF